MSRLVTDHLPLLAGAPNGVKKLRELILELAVRGKLVAQDSGDEPAEVLLGEIASEKAKLVADKKLKAMPPLPAVESSAIPFDLPPEWRWARLGDITNVGFTTKSGDILPENWILDLEDIEKDTSKLLHRARFVDRQSLSDKNKFNKGDVLYGKLRPYLNKVIVADEDGFCTTEILPIRCHGPWDNNYFKLAIMSPFFLAYVNGKSYGMKMPRLGTEDGRLALFPLPPLAEQNRIVAKVDELMALCDRLETRQSDAQAAHARLMDELLGSLLQARDAEDVAASWQRLAGCFEVVFSTEESVEILASAIRKIAFSGKILGHPQEEKWVESKLKDAVSFLNGYAFKSEWFLKQGIKLARNINISHGTIDWTEVACIDADQAEEFKNFRLKAGDILLSLDRPLISTGLKVAVVSENDLPCLLLQRVAKITPSADKLVPEFLLHWLHSPFFVNEIDPGRSNGVPHISTKQVGNMDLLLPPLEEQHRIVAKLDELLDLCNRLKVRIQQARQVQERLAGTLVERAVL